MPVVLINQIVSHVISSFAIFLFVMFFTGFSENVHPATVVHPTAAAATLRRHLIATRQVEGVPREQPIIPIRCVRVVDVLLELALVQVGHFTVVGGCLGAWKL